MIELPDIEAFFRNVPGFSDLAPEALAQTARGVEVEYFRRSSPVLTIGDTNRALHLVRSGAVQLVDDDDALVARLSEGDSFGLASLMNDAPVRFAASALEDTLIYRIDAETFRSLRQSSTAFDTHVVRLLTNRLVRRVTAQSSASAAGQSLSELATRAPVT